MSATIISFNPHKTLMMLYQPKVTQVHDLNPGSLNLRKAKTNQKQNLRKNKLRLKGLNACSSILNHAMRLILVALHFLIGVPYLHGQVHSSWRPLTHPHHPTRFFPGSLVLIIQVSVKQSLLYKTFPDLFSPRPTYSSLIMCPLINAYFWVFAFSLLLIST